MIRMAHPFFNPSGCHPKIYIRHYTAWCEKCEAVFDDPKLANDHADKTKHKVKITEYLTSHTHFSTYLVSEKTNLDK